MEKRAMGKDASFLASAKRHLKKEKGTETKNKQICFQVCQGPRCLPCGPFPSTVCFLSFFVGTLFAPGFAEDTQPRASASAVALVALRQG
jgi:hypothetical protein